MANKKINELLSRTPSLSDLMLVGDPSSGYSYKCTVTALATIIETDIADGYVTLATTQTISGAKTFSNVLTLTSVANSAVDTDKFLVLTGTNTVNYRTGAEVLSDIGGASASSISGTTNYVAKFTSSSAIGNSLIFDNGTNVGISTTSPSYKLDISGTLRSTNSSYFATGGGNIGIGTSSVTGIGGPILQIHASTYPEIHLTNSTTGDQYQDGTSIHVSGSSLNILNYESGSINLSTSGTQRVSIASDGNVTLSVIANATTDTDKFLVSDSGVIKYRTGAELLSDIGAQGSLSLSAIGSTPNANGATLSSNTLTLQPASASFGGVMTTGFQEFAGQKRFIDNPIQFDKHLEIKNNNSWGVSWGYTSFASKDTPVFGFLRGHSFTPTPTSYNAWFTYGSTGDRNYTLPSSDGTLALTSDITGAISGTTNYIPKFTSSSAIGNSSLYDDGTNIGLGTATPQTVLNGFSSSARGIAVSNAYPFIGFNDTDGGNLFFGTQANIGYIWNAGTNALVFATNNAERMRLDASGNLGLGTSSPTTALNVQSAVNVNIGNVSITSTNNDASGLSFKVRTTPSSADSRSWMIHNNYSAAGTLEFLSSTSSTGNPTTTRMTLDASGNLGLGVTPSAWGGGQTAIQIGSRAALVNASAGQTLLGNNYYSNGTNNIYLQTAAATAYEQYAGSHVWYNAPSGTAGNAISFTQAMTLDASGRLGIGTTSPLYRLQVSGTNTSLIKMSNTSANRGIVFGVDGSSEPSIQAVVDNTDVARQLSINPNGGNVGIGTTSPASIGTNYTTIDVRGSAGGGIRFGVSSAGNGALYTDATQTTLLSISNIPLVFGTNNAERMRITSGGYLLLGTTTSAYGQAGRGTFEMNGTTDNILVQKVNNTLANYIFSDNTKTEFYSTNFLQLSVNGSERMRITSGGEVLINTTSDAGDYKLQVNGNGYFSGTEGNLYIHSTSGSGKNWQLQSYTDGKLYINVSGVFSALSLDGTTGAAIFNSSIKTAAPSGGTAQPWKLGSKVAAIVTLDTANYIEVEVNGVAYKLALVN